MNGNCFLLPNKIFNEGLTPMEFVIYSFFISRKNKNNQSYYSVHHIAENCGICENSCRKVIKDLADKGLVDVMERYIGNAQQSNIYTVHKICEKSGDGSMIDNEKIKNAEPYPVIIFAQLKDSIYYIFKVRILFY